MSKLHERCWTAMMGWTAVVTGIASAAEVASPNGRLVVRCEQTAAGAPTYGVQYDGRPLIAPSTLGLELADDPPLTAGFHVRRVRRCSHDGTWTPVYGERSRIRDHYNEMTVVLEDGRSPPRRMELTFRAYDEGAAFCYTLPRQPAMERVRIERERTRFALPADHRAWTVYSAQGRYSPARVSQIKRGCERPLTIQAGPNRYLALAEARLVDYARAKFGPSGERPLELVTVLDGEVEARLPLRTPWRVIMVADRPGDLLENNDLILNLNDPCAIEDPSWVKPGKAIREVTLTTAGGKACVDFAVRRNLQYVEFDAGWYGHEYSEEADARTVSVDPKRSPGPLDLQEVVRYAEQRGVGIWLYVNRRALERQIDEILPLYRRWGIKGVKYGFVRVGSQRWTAWLHEAVRKAAANRLMVDIHDEYRPTGFSRTYPNLLTQEGIAGDETSPTNEQTLTILFTRMLAGAGDHTICYYDGRVERNATHAYQLAKAVCLYSPLQFLYWYDRPQASPQRKGGAGGSRNVIGDEPELEFFDALPTVWDDTRVIRGQIGRYAVIARRSGEQWLIGVMNSGEARTLDVPLSFLDPGRDYLAHIYYDDRSVPTRTHVGIRRRRVERDTILRAEVSAQGGQAIRIEPAP